MQQKMRFCLREVAYGFVPSGTATRIAGPGPTRIWSHWQEWYATGSRAKASLCPLKHGTVAVGWHRLPGSRAGPFSATAHLSCASEVLHTSLIYNQKYRSDMNSRQSWPRPLGHKRGVNRCQAPPPPRPACTSPRAGCWPGKQS